MPTRRPRLVLFAALLSAIAGAVCWYVFVHERSPSVPPDTKPLANTVGSSDADPRLTFETPFRNVRPDVRYLGDASCATCHLEIDKKFHAHPMGRSADLVRNAGPLERYDVAAHNPCRVGDYELFVERTGDKTRHHVKSLHPDSKHLPEYVTTADLAIGSGTRGRSYIAFDQGAAWQSPISWYGPDARWDLSPGFDLGNGGRRAIRSDCLFCHVNQTDPIPNSINRYREPFPTGQPSIGCERCHGPGELHVNERTAGVLYQGIDTSIVNPKHLSSDLQASICAQCHLQGEERIVRRGRDKNEFRPGLPLEMFLTVYVRRPELVDMRKSVGQFEQMHVSRCYVESRGKLNCTSCHDPHSTPAKADRDRFFNDKCLSCHRTNGSLCSERDAVRQKSNDSCVACHMPKADSSNIVHASVTDHRVPKMPIPSKTPQSLSPDTVPILAFPIGPSLPSNLERERDLGIALSRVLAQGATDDPVAKGMIAIMVADRTRAAVNEWPDDLSSWLALCRAYEALRDAKNLLYAATKAAEIAPDSEEAQSNLASAATMLGKTDIAIVAADKFVELNPSFVEPLLLRAGIYLMQRDWQRAEADSRTAIAIHPLHPQARFFLGICKHRRGDPSGGWQEAKIAASLVPKSQQRDAFLEYYRVQTR